MSGLFIVFEGIDGTGKNTQMELVAAYLRQKKYLVLTTFEPTLDSKEGIEVKKLLKGGKISQMDKNQLLELYLKDRFIHSAEIKSQLNQNQIVLSSRYDLSTYAYQHQNNLEYIYEKHLYFSEKNGSLIPNLTFYFDLSPYKALVRIGKREQGKKFEGFEKKFLLEKIRKQYLSSIVFLKNHDGRKIVQIDSDQPMHAITSEIKKHINLLLINKK